MREKRRILAVDDDELCIGIIKEILEQEKEFAFAGAANGDEALEVLKQFRPHLILLDIMMPGQSGVEICRLIKNDPAYTEVKIILVTGRAMEKHKIEGLRAGADAYMIKPFEEEELVAVIREHLQ